MDWRRSRSWVVVGALLTAAAPGWAAWPENLQFHGFVSQGYAVSDPNNYLPMNTSRGTATFSVTAQRWAGPGSCDSKPQQVAELDVQLPPRHVIRSSVALQLRRGFRIQSQVLVAIVVAQAARHAVQSLPNTVPVK